MSSVRVNLSKSAIISIGKVPNVNFFIGFFGYVVIYLPLILVFLRALLIRIKWFGTLLLKGFIRD